MKYRKKPVVIEAMRLTGDHDNCLECYNWVKGISVRTFDNVKKAHDHVFENGGIIINTLEGDMKACFGDYIIKGIQGEFYPCKPDIFEQTYEAVIE